MTKKNAILIAIALIAVGSIYFYLYKDYFTKGDIQIFHTIRPGAVGRQRSRNATHGNAVTFGLGKDYKLTSIKVVPVSDIETNKYPHPIWELTTQSNSVPTRAFTFGSRVQGMHSAVKGAEPDPLVPNVTYRLLVEAGSQKGHHDFKITEANNIAPR